MPGWEFDEARLECPARGVQRPCSAPWTWRGASPVALPRNPSLAVLSRPLPALGGLALLSSSKVPLPFAPPHLVWAGPAFWAVPPARRGALLPPPGALACGARPRCSRPAALPLGRPRPARARRPASRSPACLPALVLLSQKTMVGRRHSYSNWSDVKVRLRALGRDLASDAVTTCREQRTTMHPCPHQ